MTKQILVIDDQEDIRELVQFSLEMTSNWQVFTAASGLEGIEIARQNQPDVIILDVMMPEMDGPMTVEQLQQYPTTQKIPVILLTASQGSEQFCYDQLGVKAVISKLIDPANFASQVAKILNWS